MYILLRGSVPKNTESRAGENRVAFSLAARKGNLMSCPKWLEPAITALDQHTQAAVVVEREVATGVVERFPCACCYVLRLLAYGAAGGFVATALALALLI